MTGAVRALILGMVAAFLAVVPSQSQETATNVGPLQIELRDYGVWKAESRSGWLLLSNRTDPNSIQLFFYSRDVLTGGSLTVRSNVLVRGEGDAGSYAGLLFARKDAGNFMGFLIRGDGAAVWMNQTPDNTDFRVAEGVRARMDGTDILELRETPGQIEMVLNGAVALTAQNPGGFAPTYGIVTVGTGRFGFDGFAIEDANATTGPRTPVPDDRRTGPRTDDTAMTPEQARRTQILLGTTLGVLFHELGHALIGETKLPATGPEEDVADGFSAFVMSSVANETTDPDAAAAMNTMVRYSALLWYHASKAKEAAGVPHTWQDEHAPDIRRFRNIFCIIYGSNPGRYEDMALRFELTLQTREKCKLDFQKRYAAWESLMRTVTRKMPDDDSGMHPADAPGGRIILKVQTPQSAMANEVYTLMNGANAMLPPLTAFLEKAIVWPNDLTIEFRHCPGNPNAWYDPAAHAVTYCYEVTEYFANFIVKGETDEGRARDAPAADPAAFLPGQWSAQISDATGRTLTLTFVFSGNGTYTSVFSGGPQDVRTEGNWGAKAGDGGLITLELNPTKAEPAQICDPNGNCQPNRPTPARTILKIKGNDAFHMEGLDFARAR